MFMNPVTSRRLLLLAGASLITPQARAQMIDAEWDRPLDWTRNFRVGMQLGLGIKAKFTTSGSYQITANPQADNGYTFDNGYVLKDISGSTDNFTWNWGYNNASQYNPVDHTLQFQSTSSYEVNGTQSATKKDNPYLGFDLGYGWAFTRWGEAKIGAELGFSILPINISDRSHLQAEQTGIGATVSTGGIIPPLAPYNGSFEGPGASIEYPSQLNTEPTSFNGPMEGSRTLDVTLYTFRLGPTASWQLNPKIGVTVSAGGALGIVSGDYKYAERPLGSHGGFASGQFGNTDFVFGAYASGMATYRIEDHGELYLGLQFVSMSDSTFRQGGREAKLGLGSAFYITAGVNWPF